jgi:hypothetical protein
MIWSYEVTGMIDDLSFTTASFDSYMYPIVILLKVITFIKNG